LFHKNTTKGNFLKLVYGMLLSFLKNHNKKLKIMTTLDATLRKEHLRTHEQLIELCM